MFCHQQFGLKKWGHLFERGHLLQTIRQGFFRGGMGGPPGKNFANPPHLTLVPVFGPRLVPPQPRFIPENLKNLNTFLCQI